MGTILDDLLTELRGLPDETLTALEGKVKEGLFSVQPFEGLETAHLQKKYIREQFKLVASLFIMTTIPKQLKFE